MQENRPPRSSKWKKKKELKQQLRDNSMANYQLMRLHERWSICSEVNCGDEDLHNYETDEENETRSSLCSAQMRVPRPNLAKEADLFGASDALSDTPNRSASFAKFRRLQQ
jgi:hypothetical protein